MKNNKKKTCYLCGESHLRLIIFYKKNSDNTEIWRCRNIGYCLKKQNKENYA